MKTITQAEFEKIYTSGRTDDVKYGYPAMIYHPDDTITKIWAKPVKFFSSAKFKPYAQRFVQNAALITSLDIAAPEIIDYFKIKKTDVHIVQYKILPGESIRGLLETNPGKLDVPGLASFIHRLHESGVQFRTIHFGNVIQMEDMSYGLIDFCDISHSGKPLSPERRAVNLAVPMKYAADMALMQQAGLPDIKDSYLATWKPSDSERDSFLSSLTKRLERFQ